MLSEILLKQFGSWSVDAKARQDQFLKLYRQALVECGGNAWRTGDIVNHYKNIQEEIRPFCVCENGLSTGNFHAYCDAARIAILFDIPFSVSRRCKMTNLPDVVKLFDADKSDKTAEKKFVGALKAVLEAKRKPAVVMRVERLGGLPIPTANEKPEQLQYRLAKAMPGVCGAGFGEAVA